MTTTSPDEAVTRPRVGRPLPGGMTAALLGAVALTGTNALVALTPGYAEARSTADLLRLTREHASLVEAGALLGLATVLLLVPGMWALSSRLADRAPVLAGAGGWLAASGYTCFLVLPLEDATKLALVGAGGDPSSYVAAMDDETVLPLLLTYIVFGLGALVGTLVLGLAALRQRDVVPVWAGVALVASPVMRMAGLVLGIPFGPPLASLMIAGGVVGVWRGRTAARIR